MEVHTAKTDNNVESAMAKFDVDGMVENLNKITALENDDLRTEDSDGLDNVGNDSTESESIKENLEASSSKKEMFPNSQGDVRIEANFEDDMEMIPDFDDHETKTSLHERDRSTNVKQDLTFLSEPQSIKELSLKSEVSKEICEFQPEFVTSSEEGELDFSRMECPYAWEECKSKNTEMDWIGFLLCKLAKPNSNGWRLFNLELLLACMYGLEKNYSKALETLRSCEQNLEVNANDIFFAGIEEGLRHMINAAKCHTYLLSGKMDEALEIKSALLPAKMLGYASKGAILASKAYILRMFGDGGMKKALECVEMAIQLDSDNETRRGSWYYLAGKIYTKIRLIDPEKKLPGKEEMDMYQKAVDKNPFLNHVVVLACLSGEAARGFKARCAFNWRKADSYYKISMKMIAKACASGELNLKNTIRLATEMKKMPKSLCQSGIVNECLEGSLKKLNENFEQKLRSVLSTGLEQDAVKNLEDIKDSAVNLIKVMVEMNHNPLPIYDKVLDTLENPHMSKYSADLKMFLLLMKGEYYLYRKRPFLMAVKIWGKAIKQGPESPLLLSYPTQFLQNKKNLNIYKEVKEKVRILMSSKKISKGNIQFMKDILKLCENRCKNSET